MKKYFSVCLVAIFLIFSSAVAMAMPVTNKVPVSYNYDNMPYRISK